ncbi:hypothetical protein BpHYR1_018066 [Brachionus plicatilis]|uniref:Uncharacterized protein n=1 Tax=Brachionus plicatilis TaxID=10195 RepID=A0A3M7S6W6_BRAPC|nr:hypothetical protein BpHYR1_018066 [Brachionus plicatilis]
MDTKRCWECSRSSMQKLPSPRISTSESARFADKTEEQSEERWTENPSRPLDAAASEESEGITFAAEPTGGETQRSGTDSAIGQPYRTLGP